MRILALPMKISCKFKVLVKSLKLKVKSKWSKRSVENAKTYKQIKESIINVAHLYT